MAAPRPIAEPHKELRFTRSAQGRTFFVLGAMAAGLGVLLVFFAALPEEPLVPWWSALLPLPVAIVLFRAGLHCVRHAYLIFTPLGVEIFPFFNPARNLRIVYWSEIAQAEVSPGLQSLILHYDETRSSGVVASLRPVRRDHRHLVQAAIDGMMAKRLEDEETKGD